MGRKKFNLCAKCGFWPCCPYGKNCSAGVGEQLEGKANDDMRGQGPNQEGLDALEYDNG